MALLRVLAAAAAVLAGVYLALTARGLYLKRKLQETFDASALAAEGGRFVKTADGRIVEYFVLGSDRRDARILLLCHGSAMTAKMMVWIYRDSVMKEMNVRAIAITYPGHGYSDVHVPRRIADWPRDDVAPVLEAEGVIGSFMVQGWSYGTAHAMACAVHFGPDVCVAVGLNCPYLSRPICDEFGFPDYSSSLPTIKSVNETRNAFLFALIDLINRPIISRATSWLPEGKIARREVPELFDMLRRDIGVRGCIRGTAGQIYEEYTIDVTVMWGFDPRNMRTRCIAVWYAEDDSAVPPEHGQWLADALGAVDGMKVDVRRARTGHGHFSFMREANLAEGIQTKLLLEMAGSLL